LEILELKEQVGASSQHFDEATAEVTHARRHLDFLNNWNERSGTLEILELKEQRCPTPTDKDSSSSFPFSLLSPLDSR
jgi:hypothetical protein